MAQTPVSSNGLHVRFACFVVLVGRVTKHFILFDWITQISLIIINISKDQDKVEVFSPLISERLKDSAGLKTVLKSIICSSTNENDKLRY